MSTEPHDTSSGPCSCGAWHDGAPANAPVDPLDTARDQVRTLQRELNEARNLLSAERAAHAATRGIADAAVRGQMRAEERLGKIGVAMVWAAYAASLNSDYWSVMRGPGFERFNPTDQESIFDALIALHERAGK